jgi:6-hydroxytryprostatin B O-methyltransferase
LAEAFSDLSFIVQDLPEVVAEGEKKLPPHLRPRVKFQTHDFWTPQPADMEADVYLLRMILHDHPDALAIKILQNIVPGLKANARIIVQEGVMPEPGTLPLKQERYMR